MLDREHPGCSDLAIPKKLKELEASINQDLVNANLPEIIIDGFKLPEQSLELTFERETVTGVNRERLWEIINAHYKRVMREVELLG